MTFPLETNEVIVLQPVFWTFEFINEGTPKSLGGLSLTWFEMWWGKKIRLFTRSDKGRTVTLDSSQISTKWHLSDKLHNV